MIAFKIKLLIKYVFVPQKYDIQYKIIICVIDGVCV